MVCTAISITASNGDGLFYVKKGTKVTGLKNVHIASFTKKTKQNVFYVKEKTVFHAEKNTNIKVVFVSNTKEVAKDEKVISTVKKPTLQLKKRKQAQLELKPNHKLPFKFGYFNYYGNNLAVLLFNNSQNAKVNTFLSKLKKGRAFKIKNYEKRK